MLLLIGLYVLMVAGGWLPPPVGQVLLDTDFSVSGGVGANVSCIGESPRKTWVQGPFWDQNPGPCSQIREVYDPVFGTTALDLNWQRGADYADITTRSLSGEGDFVFGHDTCTEITLRIPEYVWGQWFAFAEYSVDPIDPSVNPQAPYGEQDNIEFNYGQGYPPSYKFLITGAVHNHWTGVTWTGTVHDGDDIDLTQPATILNCWVYDHVKNDGSGHVRAWVNGVRVLAGCYSDTVPWHYGPDCGMTDPAADVRYAPDLTNSPGCDWSTQPYCVAVDNFHLLVQRVRIYRIFPFFRS